MTFIEMEFFIFLVAAIVLFYLFPVKYRWIALLLISTAFYAIAGVKYLPFIFVTSFSVYLAGRQMGKIYEASNAELETEGLDRKEKKSIKEKAKKRCKRVMLLVLLLNLAILCVIKFTKFFVGPINQVLQTAGVDGTFKASMIIVPLGISYYTFSSLSYLLDVYWKRVDSEKNYFRFLLYAIYFPHILQGPIERYGRLGQRLKQELRFDYNRVVSGMQLMIYGYFKKLVIADRINIYVSGAYGSYETYGGIVQIIAMLFDVVYIYADFSGCMDIARGVSQIFGVELDLNFNHPFSSKSITEFWRRWHMSLGGWFKDYVYYPISTSNLVKNINKKAKGKLPDRLVRSIITVIPVFVTWVSTGLWHGTGKTYVAWGVYYAIMIFLSVTFEEDCKKLSKVLRLNTETKAFRFFQMARTTLIFAGGRLLTRPGTLHQSWEVFKAAFREFNPWVLFDGTLYKMGLDRQDFTLALLCIVLFGLISHYQQQGSVREMLAKQNLIVRWVVSLCAIMAIFILGIYGPGYDAAAFVYMAY